MSKTALSPEQSRFIEDMTALMSPWGMPISLGRIYAYLLLRSTPASLDDIAGALKMSKSSVSVAARNLEQHRMARRHGESGTKRVLYSASEDYAGFFADQTVMIGAVGRLLGRASSATSGAAAARMKEMSRFYQRLRELLEHSIEEIASEMPRKKR